ncbi:NAD(P)/FAD-dependent oxidoreductase [Nocardia higoensis]|uniref:NAD(P)/FAD-dependent oxidoreductase n=1 Tax=Nocardia higoensis TaxID=228599 RepID=UPI000301D6BB|nr:FAD-dependent oxidoreductase [Nocardia higoensis]
MSEYIDVVVIGGGYAGVMAANRLTRRADVRVTLVNPRPVFVNRIRLHQLIAGSDEAVVDYRDVLSERVRLLVDTVDRIDVAGRTVATAQGPDLGYDYLIYAVGSGGAAPAVPGAARFAYQVGTLEEARRLRPVLDGAPPSAPVTVVGGGSTGIEVAAELAEQGRAVTLVCGDVLHGYLHPRVRRSIARRLTRLGVTLLDGPDATAVEVTRGGVRLSGGHTLRSAVTIWTAGFATPDLAARSGLSTDALSRLLTDETLTSIDDDRIVAAGDCASPSGAPLRMSCQSARPLGAHAADTVLARIAGERPRDINVGFFGQCIGLGRRAAMVQLATKDDTVTRFGLGGRVAAMIKENACRGVIEELAAEAREPGAFSWIFRDSKRGRTVRAADDIVPVGR